MDIAAVVFDMDGLLLDSERLARAAFVDTCDHFDLGDQSALFMRCVGTNQQRGKQVLREGLHGKADEQEKRPGNSFPDRGGQRRDGEQCVE